MYFEVAALYLLKNKTIGVIEMEIVTETKSIREELKRGTVIDLQGRLYFLENVNCEKNREIRGKFEFELYKKGYLPYFNEMESIGRKARAFYVNVYETCKLYISTNPTSDKYELKYIVYDNLNKMDNDTIQRIIQTLKELDMLIRYDDSDFEKAS